MLAAVLVVTFGNRLYMTGDEPRYLLYAVSFIRHGSLTMPVAEWSRVSLRAAHVAATVFPAGGGGAVVMNGVYLPVILSPVAGLLSLAGLRAATLVAGLAGLAVLHRLLRRASGAWASLAALFVVAFSVPLLPYLHLFYMETFLFALVCWGWERLQTRERGLPGDLLTAAILMAIPIVHMRGSGWRRRCSPCCWRSSSNGAFGCARRHCCSSRRRREAHSPAPTWRSTGPSPAR